MRALGHATADPTLAGCGSTLKEAAMKLRCTVLGIALLAVLAVPPIAGAQHAGKVTALEFYPAERQAPEGCRFFSKRSGMSGWWRVGARSSISATRRGEQSDSQPSRLSS